MTTKLDVYNQLIADRAAELGIAVHVFPGWKSGVLQLTYRGAVEFVYQTSTRFSQYTTTRVFTSKSLTHDWLKKFGFSAPRFAQVKTFNDAATQLRKFGSVVVKPDRGVGGKGITLNVRTRLELQAAMRKALAFDETVTIEEMAAGFDVRLLVIGSHVFGAIRRRASVLGDGKHTMEWLRREFNRRKVQHAFPLRNTPLFRDVLRRQGFTASSIPASDELVYLSETCNLHAGGISEEITDQLSAGLKRMALNISKAFQTSVMGVDWMTEDLHSMNGKIVEVNAIPGLLMHEKPQLGTPQPVSLYLLALLFPNHPKLSAYRSRGVR